MSYYKDKRIVSIEINNLINKKNNFSVVQLQLELGRRYEVSDLFILKLLKKYEQTGAIKIIEDEVVFK